MGSSTSSRFIRFPGGTVGPRLILRGAVLGGLVSTGVSGLTESGGMRGNEERVGSCRTLP